MNEQSPNPADPSEDDSRLVRDCLAGDRAAFDRLVLRHKTKVFNLCYWTMGDYEEANEMAQESFIKAFRGIKSFRFEAAFSTWLYQIALNTCRNRVKSGQHKRKRRTLSLDEPIRRDGRGGSMDIRNGNPGPHEILEEKEREALIRKAIAALPEDQRTAVTLRDIQGFSYEEIRDIMGVNIGTVKSRLARARLALSEKLRRVL